MYAEIVLNYKTCKICLKLYYQKLQVMLYGIKLNLQKLVIIMCSGMWSLLIYRYLLKVGLWKCVNNVVWELYWIYKNWIINKIINDFITKLLKIKYNWPGTK